MKITENDIKSFLEAWLTKNEIQDIIQWEEDIANWYIYSHEDVVSSTRKSLFLKESLHFKEKEYA
jgi:hypothetical protein